ncbi:pyrroloquinoline quinone precursor peptide PqqA [Oecophyllibacter saccharovorans]|uniref:Coenzyme PQQ synthesis protein A n=1 Tax=Oecophyllibacter saccharovorans TaxID=2558360 RepID=A0A506UKT5_9PROT|nr:pyrroloquinoline quinone precursor peptide PqqA [Oecophyllibacter saccharovorans]QDH15109.1 pyrroloquinoline quinone precursor peptide PqqA [Oecophyllibacter saccharovorans]TPW33946.1 pyrroloquinoline quinone precursor peptide PqqA [Oecophyllibacter saccharovorans]TPW35287.1 pyrroloquinoline quinone precursor peptide PqqA [Oecophyllibacter saccharovorans]
MTWTTPKVTEIPLGGEINSYVCAERARKTAATGRASS